MIILGINAYHPDASVALMKDGALLWAAEEERFNRIKHTSGFPRLALQKCLEENGISPSEVNAVAISKDPRANFKRKMVFVMKQWPKGELLLDRLKAFRKAIRVEDDFRDCFNLPAGALNPKFIHVEHHKAHVASSFFLSGFERSTFLSIDGMGDFSSAMWGIGEGNHLHALGRVYFPHSAGFLYTAATQFLGFLSFGDEYKVMGLAGYGNPQFLKQFREMIRLKPDGQFKLNLDYFQHHQGNAKIRWEGGRPEQDIIYSQKWVKIFGKERQPQQPVTQREQDMAASLQVVLEEIYFHVLTNLYEKTKEKNLCLAGGVAFNGVANGKIKKNTPFENIYIQPASGDAGTAVGAAAYASYVLFKEPRLFVMNHALLGTEANEKEIESNLMAKGLSYEKLSEDKLIQETVKALVNGEVVGWFQGKMEFGPRALGNRSILADPRRLDMQDILNLRIKHRESFRPFAPAVPEEKASDYFEMDCPSSPFMIKVFPVKSKKKSLIPAVTHVDGTARVQTVSKETQPLFWKLLMEFGKQTGVYVLLNTSFNENEPIVCTPDEAINCFLKTKMDVLVLSHCFLRKHTAVDTAA